MASNLAGGRTEWILPDRATMIDSDRPDGPGAYRTLLRGLERSLDAGHAAAYLALAAAAAVLATVVVLITLAVTLGPATAALDHAIMAWVGARHGPGGQRIALQVTALGNTVTLSVLLLWLAALLLATGRRFDAAVVAAAFGGGRILNEGLKAMFDRVRPELIDWGTPVVSASFPSAHAMSSAIAYGTLAYMLARTGAGTALRWAGWAVAGVLAVGVAASRVYLGVHYPTDSAAGLIAGGIWTAIVLSAIPAARHFERVAMGDRPASRP